MNGAESVSVEIPAFKGRWLLDAVESVFAQTSPAWELSILWDGGDDLARNVVEELDNLADPRVRCYFGDRRGIAAARRFLTERSQSPWILTLDDDDLLTPDAVQRFLETARERPWAGIVRARREFIDQDARHVDEADWFPFADRAFQHGMITDVFNHSQPALIRRSAYERTAGWSGFPEYKNAGEDCDVFVRVEEIAPVELLDRVLYRYRLNSLRTSHELGPESARDMWRRIADGTIARLGLPLRRLNDVPPFRYEKLTSPRPTRATLDCVVAGSGDAGLTRRSLLRQGLSDYAVRVVPGDLATARNAGFDRAVQPVVCFADAGTELAPGAVDAMLRTAGERDADVVVAGVAGGRAASPLLVRSQTFRAVGGFDAAFTSADLVTADFLLAAARRDFTCVTLDGLATRAPRPADAVPAEVDRLLRKWHVPVIA
jgi:glycosyltransferase involved in cell wall biosynthesis